MRSLVVADTSSLIIFEKLDCFGLLPQIYDQVVTTPEILNEYGHSLPNWFIIKSVQNQILLRFLESRVDTGEASAIALVMELNDALLILDDLKARKLAKQMGLKLTGSLGVLSKAKDLGVLKQIRPIVDKLRETDFRISEKILEALLEKHGEL